MCSPITLSRMSGFYPGVSRDSNSISEIILYTSRVSVRNNKSDCIFPLCDFTNTVLAFKFKFNSAID